MRTRVIPRIDVKGDRLVKGIRLEGWRQLGDPADFARRYYEQGADELLVMDVVASLFGRNSIFPLIERITADVFVPITVGGGIRTLADIRAALLAGADRVAINTAALRDPEFLPAAAAEFGRSTIVVAVEAKRRGAGWEAYTDCGRERTGRDAVAWAIEASQWAGELLLTSVDREGCGSGFDCELVHAVAPHVSCPVLAHGGCGSAAHAGAARAAGASGVCAASWLHAGRGTVMEMKEGLRVAA